MMNAQLRVTPLTLALPATHAPQYPRTPPSSQMAHVHIHHHVLAAAERGMSMPAPHWIERAANEVLNSISRQASGGSLDDLAMLEDTTPRNGGWLRQGDGREYVWEVMLWLAVLCAERIVQHELLLCKASSGHSHCS